MEGGAQKESSSSGCQENRTVENKELNFAVFFLTKGYIVCLSLIISST